MSKVTQALGGALVAIGFVLASGCATPPPKLTYVALVRPTGPIKATGSYVITPYSRGGPYFLNYGFRPAPDIGAYIAKAQADAGADCLKNADVRMEVPFIPIHILILGLQLGDDVVTANY